MAANGSSIDRALLRCPHAGRCPGCDYLGEEEVEHDAKKRESVKQAFRTFELPEALVSAIVPATPRTHYRTRAKLVLDGGTLGLYRRGTHEVESTEGCLVLSPALESVLREVRRLPLGSAGVTGVDARAVDEGVLLTLIAGERYDEQALRTHASELRQALPELVGVAVSHRKQGQVALLGSSHEVLNGVERAKHTLGPLPYHYATYGSFVQAHEGSATALYTSILSRVQRKFSKAEALELHAGSGTLSLALASRGHAVTAVESYAPAVRLLAQAAEEQHLALRSETADAGHWLKGTGKFDVVLVNPPRRGLEPPLRKGLLRAAPELILYVSCDPYSLARDLRHFELLGYRATEAVPFDLMPQAATIETLVELQRDRLTPPRILHEDHELLAVLKEAHESTHPQGDGIPSLLDRVKLLPGCANAAPIHRLDAETSGVCLFAKEPKFVQELSQALTAGSKTYLALARGITHKGGTIKKTVQDGRERREATTRYQRIDVLHGHSLLVVHPQEGRRHQIRQHLKSIHHPIIGDSRYGDPKTNTHFFSKHYLDRTALHCLKIALGGRRDGVEIQAPLPPELRQLLAGSSGLARF